MGEGLLYDTGIRLLKLTIPLLLKCYHRSPILVSICDMRRTRHFNSSLMCSMTFGDFDDHDQTAIFWCYGNARSVLSRIGILKCKTISMLIYEIDIYYGYKCVSVSDSNHTKRWKHQNKVQIPTIPTSAASYIWNVKWIFSSWQIDRSGDLSVTIGYQYPCFMDVYGLFVSILYQCPWFIRRYDFSVSTVCPWYM